ncbi:MAG: hypothetical protein B7Z33_04930 [Sphingomonadales bacterium 12-68-11]|nr:MAG: hypothetical protein B7Z33_04930 [Sphingomonadales bacterium 12-68-11]
MFGLFRTESRAPRRQWVSALALGAVVAVGVAPATAQAQRQQRQQQAPQPSYSREFTAVYQPIADVANAPAGDFAAARTQIPGMLAAAQTADDRYAAGNVLVVLGTKLNDRPLQRQGLELMLASGKVPAEQLGQVQFFIGSLAYDAKDWQAARAGLAAAKAAGYTDAAIVGLTAESYFGEGQIEPGLDYLQSELAALRAAGQPLRADWIRRGLRVALEGRSPKVGDWSALLVSAEPSPENWAAVLQIVGGSTADDKQVQLDLLRLMRLANAMTDRREYVAYIEAADPRIMSNEVTKVLDAAVAAGVLTTGDEYYTEIKRIVDLRVPEDRRDAPSLVAEARTGTGSDALNAGDVLYSLEQFAEAEEMFRLATEKGGADRDRALTRLGIAQVQQGKLDAAKATFAQVAGARAPIARLWEAYIDSKAA